VNKHLHPSTNPEILVKIGPLASEKQVLESRQIKKIRNAWQSLAYSLLGTVELPLANPNETHLHTDRRLV